MFLLFITSILIPSSSQCRFYEHNCIAASVIYIRADTPENQSTRWISKHHSGPYLAHSLIHLRRRDSPLRASLSSNLQLYAMCRFKARNPSSNSRTWGAHLSAKSRNPRFCNRYSGRRERSMRSCREKQAFRISIATLDVSTIGSLRAQR